jgi:hypothetical protein
VDVRTRVDLAMNAQTKEKVKDFFLKSLEGTNCNWPLRGVQLWINGRGTTIHDGGYWHTDNAGNLFIGNTHPGGGTDRNDILRQYEKLAIIGGLICVTGFREDKEITDKFTIALGRVLTKVYKDAVSPLIEPKDNFSEVTQMAFSADGAAAKINGVWRGLNGEEVDVTEVGWTTVEM